jgi:hypothetical protein
LRYRVVNMVCAAPLRSTETLPSTLPSIELADAR